MIAWMLQNAVVATVLALLVWGTCHWKRLGPAARHALWMLVLIKLLMPPVVSWPWAVTNPLARAQAAPGAPVGQDTFEAPPAPASPVPGEPGSLRTPATGPEGRYWTLQRAVEVLTVVWLSGVAAYLLLQGVRIVRIARRTATAKQAPALEEMAARLSLKVTAK
jgi:beta-lactamase regulating signal transducer with metallopeptidase domain